jgi:hypothetical protein
MKHYRVITQILIIALFLLSACKAKPTPTPTTLNPVLPVNSPDSSQPSDSIAKSVIDGYLSGIQKHDWASAYSYLGSGWSGYSGGPVSPGFTDLNNFITVAESTLEKKGDLTSWTYESIEWKYGQHEGGGYYYAVVNLFRNWSSGYREKDDFVVGDVSQPGSGKYVIVHFSEIAY